MPAVHFDFNGNKCLSWQWKLPFSWGSFTSNDIGCSEGFL